MKYAIGGFTRIFFRQGFDREELNNYRGGFCGLGFLFGYY